MVKYIKGALVALTTLGLVLLASCDVPATKTLADFISAPYGYVYDFDGTTPLSGAVVTATPAGGTAVNLGTTSSTGYFTGTTKVGTKGGTWTITVTKTGYTFPTVTKIVDPSDFLWSVGSLLATKPASTFTVSGKAFDGRSGAILSATISLKNATTGASAATDVTSDATTGAFSFTGLLPGKYRVEGTKAVSGSTAYFFVPEPVEVNGANATKDIMGLSFDTVNDDYGIAIVALWDPNFADVDLHLTYPKSGQGITGTGPTFPGPAYLPTTGAGAGFAPESLASVASASWGTYRETLNYGSKNSTSTFTPTGGTVQKAAQLDVDKTTGSGPETIIIRTQPWTDNGTTTTDIKSYTGDTTAINATYNGVMEVYLRAYSQATGTANSANSFLSTTNSANYSANARVYIVQMFKNKTGVAGGQPGADILGLYTIPQYTNIKNASIARIHSFKVSGVDQFLIFPDLQMIPDTDYLGTRFRALGNGVLVPKHR